MIPAELLGSVDEALQPWRDAKVKHLRWRAGVPLTLRKTFAVVRLKGGDRPLRFTAWTDYRRSAWHDARAGALERGLVRKIDRCGKQVHGVGCSCCRALTHSVRARCDDRFCDPCSRRYFGRLQGDLVRAVTAHMAAARHEDRMRHTFHVKLGECEHCGKHHPAHGVGRARAQLWTLSVSHGCDAAETRARITKGWVRLRAWLHKLLGRAVPYALVWEWTEGDDGRAHVHAHVLVLAPPLCWRLLSLAWQRATEGWGGGIGHARPRKAGASGQVSAAAAARYMAKYASKGSGGVDRDGAYRGCTNPVLLAEVWASGYARRRVTASRGWWVRVTRITPCCRWPWAIVAVDSKRLIGQPRVHDRGEELGEIGEAARARDAPQDAARTSPYADSSL